jgi:hypothetical protein
VTIPTQDTDGRKLEWTVFSFGSRASASERSAASLFRYSMEALNEQDGTAIPALVMGTKQFCSSDIHGMERDFPSRRGMVR